MLIKFSKIESRAEKRKGGAEAIEAMLSPIATRRQLLARGDDRYLSIMTKIINQAGFSWKVIDNKWPQFEEAFFKFDVNKLGLLSPAQWEAYTSDTRVVRNWQKISALRDNVYFVHSVAQENGSFGKFLADWPVTDQVGLMLYLKKHAARLGGNSGQYFLRFAGKDSFILSRDVVSALRAAGLEISATPTSQRDLKKVQGAFNSWQEETGRPVTHLSQIAAWSYGENYRREH